MLLRHGVPITAGVTPKYDLSAAKNPEWRFTLCSRKLDHIREIFECFISRNRWITQLQQAGDGVECVSGHDAQSEVPTTTDLELRALRTAQVRSAQGTGLEVSAARVHSILRRRVHSSRILDETLVQDVAQYHSIVGRAMLRPKRQHNEVVDN